MRKSYIETDYFKCRKNAERIFWKRYRKQMGIWWHVKQFIIWLLLFFVPTYENWDFENGDFDLACKTCAKKLLGHIYIMQNNYYAQGKLIKQSKMTLKDMFYPNSCNLLMLNN